jgi:hypothetical protein
MKLYSKFNCGDIVWCIQGSVNIVALTVGQVSIKITDSPGISDSIFDNYKPHTSREEQYMCVESGIGSGAVYSLNKNIFATKKQAEYAIDIFDKGCTCMKDPNAGMCTYCMLLLERG